MAVALIVAAGRGERRGCGRPKALVTVAGHPMLEWSVLALQATPGVTRIVLALPESELAAAPAGTVAVPGGAVRSDSVRRALAASGEGDPVIVHDAARPLAGAGLFARALAALSETQADAVLAAAPVPDTIKEVAPGDTAVLRTVDRRRLWAVQTPQVFRRAALEQALAAAPPELLAQATDEAWLIERAGGSVHVLDAGEPNFKVTTAADLQLAELVLQARAGAEHG
jgi:2-C-methyl-D-erythritol 4-phosphate cytidylyltransferase